MFSDHDFVTLCFERNKFNPGVWKLNNSYLHNAEFIAHIRTCFTDLAGAVDLFPSKKLWWDIFKESIKTEAISFFACSMQLSYDHVRLTNRLIKLKQKLSRGDQSVISDITSIKAELKALIAREWEGVKIRSKACWLEEWELPMLYFFNLEHEKIEKNRVSSIFHSTGSEVLARN